MSEVDIRAVLAEASDGAIWLSSDDRQVLTSSIMIRAVDPEA